MNSPLKDVVTKILQHQARVWSYEDDFDELWALLDGHSCDVTGKHIILWLRTPRGNCYPVHTDPLVSPIVWAVCAALRREALESLRVTILDLNPAIHGDTVLRDQLSVFREESIPWLKIVPWTELLKDDSEAIWTLFSTPGIGLPAQPNGDVALQELRKTVRLMLTDPAKPDDRHAISNLVGPMILLGHQPTVLGEKGASGGNTAADHLAALDTVLEVCGLIRARRTEASGAKQKAPFHLANFCQWVRDNGSIEFILVDDQFRNGWGQVVCDMLGASLVSPTEKLNLTTIGRGCDGALTVSASESAEFIVSELEKPGPSDRRFNLRLGSDADHQVLFLDLRLYAGKPVHEEAKFFRKIAAIARARFCNHADLPWPGFSPEELDRLDSWLKVAVEGGNSDRSDSIYLEVLTLLPRVLALSDLSLPIVIFSSTTQRRITVCLQDYQNIIVEFAKPAVHGYNSHDLVAQTYANFEASIERCLRPCKARTLCRNVLRLAEQADRFTINRRSDKSVVHYELYIDESGSSIVEDDPDTKFDDPGRFTIGGLLVEYAEALGADELHKRMEAQDPPLRWWPNRFADPFLAKSGKPLEELPDGARKRSADEVIEKFLEVAPQNSIGVCLEYRDDGSPQPEDEVEALSEADNRYRRMLCYLLEAVLFDILPEVVVKSNATLSIFVATRVRKAKEFKGGKALLARLMDRFGFDGDLKVSEPYVQTMDDPFVVSILSEIKKRREDKLVAKSEHIRGVVLHYPEKGGGGRTSPKWPNTRHQHYLADIVARGARQFGSQLEWKWSGLFKRGIYNIFDDRLVALTNSARAISRGETSAAVLELQNFDFAAAIPRKSSSWIVINRLRRALLHAFSGMDFIATSVELGRQRAVAQLEAEGDVGSVKFYDIERQFGYIGTDSRDCKFGWRDWRSATQPRRGESVRFVRITRPDLTADRVEWVQSLT